jgi:hypothetical protein
MILNKHLHREDLKNKESPRLYTSSLFDRDLTETAGWSPRPSHASVT